MSKARRSRLKQKQEHAKHLDMLVKTLKSFYEFLEMTPKPTDDDVRSEFIKSDNIWKTYCAQNHLNPRASLLFNQEVAKLWKIRYTKQESAFQNQTQELLQ